MSATDEAMQELGERFSAALEDWLIVKMCELEGCDEPTTVKGYEHLFARQYEAAAQAWNESLPPWGTKPTAQ